MMQATKPWHGDDLAACIMIDLGFTPRRRSLCQSEMRSVLVVIADVLRHQAFQMLFVEHNDVVEQIAAVITEPIPRMGRKRCDQCSCW